MKDFAKIGAAVTMTALASMGANAATYNFSVSGSSTVAGAASGSGTSTGTAVWDDVAGTVTLSTSGNNNITVGPTTYVLTISATANFSGNAGSPFSPTSGDNTIDSCSDTVGGFLCSQSGVGVTSNYNSVSGSLTAAGGTLFGETVSGSGTQTATADTTYTLSAVPIPAAAWLFGSGLIGMAGVARRRRRS